jgi:DNA (cytosine-5)-methyltransferase 1
MDAAGHALRNLLGERVEHVFSSDVDKYCCETLKANFPPTVAYFGQPAGDIRLRTREKDQVPDCQVYFAGFPCQPHSKAGKRLGAKDPRHGVVDGVLRYLREHEPPIAILENVKGIFSSSKRTVWKQLMEDLRAIGDGCYMVQSKVLNTRDHGLPQNRERVYIVLQHRFKTKVIAFKWPEPIPCPPLEHFLDGPKPELEHLEGPASKHAKKAWEANLAKLRSKGIEPEKHTYLFDTGISTKFAVNPMLGRCPCLMASSHQYWISNYDRPLNLHEQMRIQGFDPKQLKQAVSTTQLRKQLGNAMSVNVVERLLSHMQGLPRIFGGDREGLPPVLPDRWANGAAQAALRGAEVMPAMLEKKAAAKASAKAPAKPPVKTASAKAVSAKASAKAPAKPPAKTPAKAASTKAPAKASAKDLATAKAPAKASAKDLATTLQPELAVQKGAKRPASEMDKETVMTELRKENKRLRKENGTQAQKIALLEKWNKELQAHLRAPSA